jgi:hypothetical protein
VNIIAVVLEIAESRAVIIACHDTPEVLDIIAGRADAFCARTARDELLLIGPPQAAGDLLAYAAREIERGGCGGLALDMTDAWAICTVAGDAVLSVWERFSENHLPAARPVLVQGAVASIPAKAIVCNTCIHFMTPSPVRHHLPERILLGCRDLAPRVCGERPFALN